MGGLAGRCTRSSHYSNAVSPRLGGSRRGDWEHGYNWAHGHTAAVRVTAVTRARKIRDSRRWRCGASVVTIQPRMAGRGLLTPRCGRRYGLQSLEEGGLVPGPCPFLMQGGRL